MAEYRMGSRRDTGASVFIRDADILGHMLICGGAEMGKTRLLASLAEQHLDLGRQLVAFDTDLDLYEHLLVSIVRRQTEDSPPEQYPLVIDTVDEEHVVCINPLTRTDLDRGEQLRRIWMNVVASTYREGGGLPESEWTLLELAEVLRTIGEPETYVHRSLGGGRKYSVDIAEILLRGSHVLAHVPMSPGSALYRLLLMDQVLSGLVRRDSDEPLLVFVDTGHAFLTSTAGDLLQTLTQRKVGLVLTFSFQDLDLLRQREKGLYSLLLDRCNAVVSFGGDEDEPEEVLHDVESRLWSGWY